MSRRHRHENHPEGGIGKQSRTTYLPTLPKLSSYSRLLSHISLPRPLSTCRHPFFLSCIHHTSFASFAASANTPVVGACRSSFPCPQTYYYIHVRILRACCWSYGLSKMGFWSVSYRWSTFHLLPSEDSPTPLHPPLYPATSPIVFPVLSVNLARGGGAVTCPPFPSSVHHNSATRTLWWTASSTHTYPLPVSSRGRRV